MQAAQAPPAPIPAEAARFARETGRGRDGHLGRQPASASKTRAAVWTLHRLRAIEAVTEVPLVIHGGSGVPLAQRAELAAHQPHLPSSTSAPNLRMAFGAALRAAVNRDPARFDRIAILKETHAPVFDAARLVFRNLGASGRA